LLKIINQVFSGLSRSKGSAYATLTYIRQKQMAFYEGFRLQSGRMDLCQHKYLFLCVLAVRKNHFRQLS